VATGSTFNSSPAVAGGIVYAGASDGKLRAWNALNGAPIAGFPVTTGGISYSSPAVAGGIVYIGSDDHKLYAWNATTGAPVPGFPVTTGNYIWSSPAVANGIVYVGSENNTLYAWDALNGAPVWQLALPGNFGFEGFDLCSPTIAEGKLFLSADSANGIFVYSAPAATPSITPTFSASPSFTHSPTLTPSPSVTPTATATPKPLILHLWRTSPNPSGGGGTYIAFHLSTAAFVSVAVYTVSGEKVTDLDRTFYPEGNSETFWDNKNRSANPVASGVFIIRVDAESPAGERQHDFEKCSVLR
jgi:WD40 repeat protein